MRIAKLANSFHPDLQQSLRRVPPLHVHLAVNCKCLTETTKLLLLFCDLMVDRFYKFEFWGCLQFSILRGYNLLRFMFQIIGLMAGGGNKINVKLFTTVQHSHYLSQMCDQICMLLCIALLLCQIWFKYRI